MDIKGWKRLKIISQGNVEIVLSGMKYAVSSLSFTTSLKYTMQLEWLISIPSPNSSMSLSSTPFFLWFKVQEMTN